MIKSSIRDAVNLNQQYLNKLEQLYFDLNQIDKLSGEGNNLQTRINHTKGYIQALEWAEEMIIEYLKLQPKADWVLFKKALLGMRVMKKMLEVAGLNLGEAKTKEIIEELEKRLNAE